MLRPVIAVALVLASATTAAAQQAQTWNDPRTDSLVRLAVERRAQQLADTGLADFRATAHGYLTFLAQLGSDPDARGADAFTEPPRVVKADELMLEIFWKAPNLSKQRIVGRRDTLLLPTDINYHRDHLGIVQNNFPDIIRLGDGDEVLDVPHPLSAGGMAAYDYAIRDSQRVRLPDRLIEVYEVRVRPKDDRQPRAIGAVFIDRGEGQVVRMAFSFTRAALRDKQLEDVSIVLENALIETRFWLPSRQEIEIRRTGSWLDYPARGIIRGRWEICCYAVNQGLPRSLFGGPEIVQAPANVVRAHPWSGRILDSLPPDVRAVTDEDVQRVQDEARELVRGQALARTRQTSLSARRASDFVSVNRVEGLGVGGAVSRRFGGGVSASLGARWGLDDEQAKGRLSIAWQRASGVGVRASAYRSYRDASDVAETSLIRNSLAAQEFGSDYTEPYDVRGAGLTVDLGRRAGVLWRLAGAYESHDPLAVHARPSSGSYARTIPATNLAGPRMALGIMRPTGLSWLGTELRLDAEFRAMQADRLDDAAVAGTPLRFGHAFASLRVERPMGDNRLVLHAVGSAAAGPSVPPQELVYFGGPTTGPGYEFHEFAGRGGLSQRLEYRNPIRFVSVPLGRFGSTGRSATLAPFVHAVYIARPASFQPARRGWYPSLGLGTLALFDILRLDVARGLRNGRWTFSIDARPELWGIL
ncbi:MAG TPA: hypothetical protein VKA84_01735 [Gemmatimonadaceae bacterium]|nr:hypothetical protein [Gemmatimonadaceae bacterium]